jgi:hypothetical protein
VKVVAQNISLGASRRDGVSDGLATIAKDTPGGLVSILLLQTQ